MNFNGMGEVLLNAQDVMQHLDQVIPYYQAIFSADSHLVLGYEMLGRVRTQCGVQSLGPLFHDPEIPDSWKMAVDHRLQTQALETFLKTPDDVSLFMNVNANHLMIDEQNWFNRLIAYRKRGLRLNRIVLEITEHDFNGNFSALSNVLKALKSLGVKIAIDDLGKGASNLDRIGILEPDILKVDIHSLKQNEPTHSYHGVIYSLALLARKIGAELLFEGIENKLQFHYSWRKNGRYYQGYFFSKPQSSLVDRGFLKHQFKEDIHRFIHLEQAKVKREFELAALLNERFRLISDGMQPAPDLDAWLGSLSSRVGDIGFRMYITDFEGFQITSNVVKENGEWRIQPDMKGKNWSWRPYFIENLIRMNLENCGILSDPYSDIATGEIIRTFSFPLPGPLFLFIDIPDPAAP